jgi:hypothetical protein
VHDQNRTVTERTRTERSPRPSLNPYYVDDVALTYSDVMRARDLDRRVAAVG